MSEQKTVIKKRGMIEESDCAFTANARQVFEKLKRQYDEPEKCLREIVQNSRDAGADEIIFQTDIITKINQDDDSERFPRYYVIKAEDNGCGMSDFDREEKFLKLFNEGKEFDATKIGKFGVGVVSLFAYDPEFVIVESKKEGEDPWKYRISKTGKGELLDSDRDDTGTSVTVIKKSNEDKYDMDLLVSRTLNQTCRYIEPDLIFNGRKLNKKFDFESIDDSGIKVRIDNDIISDGVIAISNYNKICNLYNGYIHVCPIVDDEIAKIIRKKDFKMMVNCDDLDLVISRNAPIKNKKYNRLIDSIKTEAEKFDVKIYDYLEKDVDNLLNSEDMDSYISLNDEIDTGINVNKLWEHVTRNLLTYAQDVGEKKSRFSLRRQSWKDFLPKEIMKKKIFLTTGGDRLSIKDLERIEESDNIYYATRKSFITEKLDNLGYTVIYNHRSNVNHAVSRIIKRELRNANYVFSRPKTIDPEDVDEEEREFFNSIKDVAEGSLKYLSKLELGEPEREMDLENMKWLFHVYRDEKAYGGTGKEGNCYGILNRKGRGYDVLKKLYKLDPEYATLSTCMMFSCNMDYNSLKPDVNTGFFKTIKNLLSDDITKEEMIKRYRRGVISKEFHDMVEKVYGDDVE